MARFQPLADTPNQIRNEGQTITLSFVKTSPTTGRVSWNVPDPTIGCNRDTQAYNGIVITFDTVPSSIASTPTNVVVYNGDATTSQTLHAGDKIGSALVVGAFYDDKTTTFLDVTDIPLNTPLYFSAYAVDRQLRYHREGVHAYSLATTGTDTPNRREKLPAYQQVLLGTIDNTSLFDIVKFINGNISSTGANATDPTGLDPLRTYSFNISTDRFDTRYLNPQTITINGADAQTFGDLVEAITTACVDLASVQSSATKPNLNAIFFNLVDQNAYIWNGDQHNVQPTFNLSVNPQTINVNDLWYNPTTEELKTWNGTSWDVQTYLSSNINPTTGLSQTSYWYDGTIVRKWNGVVWCDVVSYTQTTDPSNSLVPGSGAFWFNTNTNIMSKWDETCKKWINVNVIHSDVDPETVTVGDFWFDTETNSLYSRVVGAWVPYPTTVVVSTTAPSTPENGTAWFNESSDKLYLWDGSEWIEQVVIIYFADPTDRDSCQLWWNSLTDDLYVWADTSPSGWVLVTELYQTETDPVSPPQIEAGSAWFNTATNVLYIWDGIDWIETSVLSTQIEPNLPSVGYLWYNPELLEWKRWDGSSWIAISPFTSDLDRSSIATGSFWFDGSSLQVWNGIAWTSVLYQTTPYTPAVGYQYFNTTDQLLYEWTTSGWVDTLPPVYAVLNQWGNLVFVTKELGSTAYVNVRDVDLFRSLSIPTTIYRPEPGRDEIPGAQGHELEGVGTDGTSDERRQLQNFIQQRLGYPNVAVELTTEQLDTCIRLALGEFRKRSASAYKRGFFFLQIKPGEQIYELTDKTVGFNKISRVMAAYRIQSSFLGNATGQGAYGQAMLQHLYQMGSFDLVSYHIMSDYVELMNMMFAANLVFTFDEDMRKLYFHQTFGSSEKVLLDVVVERTEQDLMRDRICKLWLEQYALGKAMLILAEQRGKYATLPGAGGGVTLNSQDLRTTGNELIEQCMAEIDDFTANEIESIGLGADIVMG